MQKIENNINRNFELPSIVKETSRGIASISINDDCFSKRQLFIFGDISLEMGQNISMALLELDQNSKEEITIFINSKGGLVDAGLAIYDTMKSISSPIKTVCLGTAASMAAVLFIAGDKREMYKHSKLLLHGPLIPFEGSINNLQLKGISDGLKETYLSVFKIIYENSSSCSGTKLSAFLKAEKMLDCQECIEFGFAEKIIEYKKQNRRNIEEIKAKNMKKQKEEVFLNKVNNKGEKNEK
jgi:ATP-dependent Clp protease protease subunit